MYASSRTGLGVDCHAFKDYPLFNPSLSIPLLLADSVPDIPFQIVFSTKFLATNGTLRPI
jgi:hypothetical protein